MKTNYLKMLFTAACVASLMTVTGCNTAPSTRGGKADIESESAVALARAKANDRTLVNVFNNSAGYAVFPSVGKGAAGIGGAYGKGVFYEHGIAVGYCDLSQATVGLQLGGQTYTEILVFENTNHVNTFKHGNFEFDAQATAVAIKSGEGANAKFANGVKVFTMNESGLMFEASVGGQKFSYQPK